MKGYISFLLMFFTLNLFCQTEEDLKRALEGKRVEVLIEMPASSSGIDLEIHKPNKINFDQYSDRIKDHGIALYPGDIVMITKIKKKSKHIEFQLAGGGFGTFGDESGNVSPHNVPKTSRQKDIEKKLDEDKNKQLENRKELKKELDDLKRERRIAQDQAKRDAAIESEMKKSRIQSQKLQAGSRFNIRYDYKIGFNELTVESIQKALETYVNFNLTDSNNGSISIEESGPVSLRKGLTVDEVISLLGLPKNMNTTMECDFEKMICSFENDDQLVEAVFVEKILIKYTVSSK
jgi:hypothetical protein